MADSSSQPGTSTGSGNVNNIIYGPIGTFNQHNPVPSTSSAKIEIDYCPAPVSTFLGRSEELMELKTLLTQHQMVALVGMGGLGKTQLSRKYVQINKADYKYKYWLESETPEKLENSFKKFAKKLHVKFDIIDDEVVNDVYKKIGAVPTILVFDNVEKSKHVYAYLPTRVDLPSGVTIHVLLTSRWAEWTCDEQIQCYKLQLFDISTSLQIFQRKFEESCIQTMQDEWEELARMLGYLPLALQVATSYIYKRNKYNSDLPLVLADYMKQLKEGADGLLNDPLTEYGNRSVYASMMLTLQQLENKAEDDVANVKNNVQWKLAVTIINAVAYIDPDIINKQYLLKLLDNQENICKVDEALAILTEYSLLNQRIDWRGNTIYSVHRIIQTSIRHNQTLMGTADMYYIRVLKYAFTEKYFLIDVAQYIEERASAVADYYKDNPSPTILEYLVLFKAVIAMEAVLKLISNNQIPIAMKEHGLLYRAVDTGDLKMIQLLCKYGADINQLHRERGQPLLHRAVRWGYLEIATWLLENGAAPSVRDTLGCNALHVAIRFANFKMVPIIIKIDKDVVNVTDNYGRTPLLDIGYSDNEVGILSTTHVLVENGADITAVDMFGNTVLHAVTHSACVAAVSLILQLNNDLINIKNKNGQTALHVIRYDNTRIDDERILSTIRVLVDSGGDLTKVDKCGNTVLHLAAYYAHAAAVSLLLQLNKNLINITNKDGKTALHVLGNRFHFNYKREESKNSLFARMKEIARMLIMNGLSLDTRDNNGCTPLDTVLPEFKDILLKVAAGCNNQLPRLPVIRQGTE